MSSLDAANIFHVAEEVVLVTGASSGLGERFALVLAANGARVALLGRRKEGLDRVADAIGAAGGKALAVPFDVTDHASVSALFDSISSSLGPVSVLVNNAGIAGDGEARDITYERWREIMDTNLDSVFTLSTEFARRTPADRGGSIINISSILGLRPTAGKAAYSVAKAGVVQLSGVLALEMAPLGIRVNTLAPGYTVTNMNRAYFLSPESSSITSRIPLKRVGQVEDFDGIILFLASRASRFVTGATFVVDGGHSLTL